ncbi:MAG: hypothetical protein VYA20_00535 [Candidatus Neomarinimicrobiota bacterium]|nr:hypothetical protein [Candidatus Neomarinimicrobiota bacterium]
MSIYKSILKVFYALLILFLIFFIIAAGIVYKQLSSGVEYTFEGDLNNKEITEDYFVTVYDPSFYLGLETNGQISLNVKTSSGKFYYKPDSLAINILSIEGATIQSEISVRDIFYLASKLIKEEEIDKRIIDEAYINVERPVANLKSIQYINDSFLKSIDAKKEDLAIGNFARKYLPKILIETSNDSKGNVVDGTCTYYLTSDIVDCPIIFEFTGNAYFNPSNKFSLDSFKLHLLSERDFNATYIGALFDDVNSIGYIKDKEIRENIIKSRYDRRKAEVEGDTEKIKILNKELEDIKMKLKEVSFLDLVYEKPKGDLPLLNGVINVKNSKMDLKTFPADLKPESIRSLSLQLKIKDNIGSINLDGLVTNPKVRLKFQKKSNLQITGNINFTKILEPELDLYVNGSDIYFALLENTNLNGIADLFVTIKGQNVLDLNGKVDIKKSNGFLTPLKDSAFQLEHNLTKENNG